MAYSYSDLRIVFATLKQIDAAIDNIKLWNEGIMSPDDYLTSTEGMKTLAATSMLIEAIGEGIKKIHSRTGDEILSHKPDIPWHDIIGIRNFLAHGYFDIDAPQIYDVVINELPTLKSAIIELIDVVTSQL